MRTPKMLKESGFGRFYAILKIFEKHVPKEHFFYFCNFMVSQKIIKILSDCRFLTKIIICDKKFFFWQKLWRLTKFSFLTKFSILTEYFGWILIKISTFGKEKFQFWLKFQFFDQNFDFFWQIWICDK